MQMKQEDLLFAQYPDIMSVGDMRAALHVGRLGAYRLLQSGEVRSFKIGNIYKIPKTALIEYVEKNSRLKAGGEHK